MKVQTLSIVVGTKACNARCPFCVSQMTGFQEIPKEQEINLLNLKKCILHAKISGVTTVLLTGKGEPTLYPNQITTYLRHVGAEFPYVELQTNALEIGKAAQWELMTEEQKVGRTPPRITNDHLAVWRLLGLNTIAISTVGIEQEWNQKVYHPDYPQLDATITYLHSLGFTVRLCVMMQKGYTDSPEKVHKLINWCDQNKVDQLTIRPIRRPETTYNSKVSDYVYDNGLADEEVQNIYNSVQQEGTLLLQLMHGAEVYDVRGQNICITDCLTSNSDPEQMRQLIFYADGKIAYDWQHKGAILLNGWST